MFRRVAVLSAAFGLIVACGGSTVSIGDPPGGSSGSSGSSGTSGTSGTSGNGAPDCSNVGCPDVACPYGGTTPPGQCCPVCNPKPETCASNPGDSCSNKKGCAAGYERFEYGPGCCTCRLADCKTYTCDPATSCPPGSHSVLAGCCGTCVPDSECKTGEAPCKDFDCPKGYKPYGLSGGNCCSSCEVDGKYCEDKRKAYEAWKAQKIEQESALKCAINEDCVVANLSNKCAGDCGTALAKAKASQIQSAVTSYGATNCADCPPAPIGCPAVVMTAKCSQGKCILSL